jgi:Family of unknown function (DUF6064)
MNLPFGVDEFLGVFARYNTAVWPAQIVLTSLAVGAVLLVLRPAAWSDRAVSGILALLWLWMSGVYHLGFFRAINPAATVFGALFLLEEAALGALGTWRRNLRFRMQPTLAGVTRTILIGFALVGYPLLSHGFGHRYPESPTFGLPCPTTILTLGLLLWAEPPAPWSVLAIPLAWSAIGTSAALQLGVREDLGLVVAGVVTALLILFPKAPRTRRRRILSMTSR